MTFKDAYIVAVVPAKSTSKRLPKKNLLDFGGAPLFSLSVRAAQLTSNIDEVYVSSESDELLEIAESIGAETIKRPAILSQPDVTNQKVVAHVLEQIKLRGRQPDFLILLQPTHPLRNPNDIEDAIAVMKQSPGAHSLFSVVKTDELRGTIEQGLFKPEYALPRNKASEPTTYRNTGSFYILRVSETIEKNSFFGKNIKPYVLNNPEFEVDIDEESDLLLAKTLLEAHHANFAQLIRVPKGKL